MKWCATMPLRGGWRPAILGGVFGHTVYPAGHCPAARLACQLRLSNANDMDRPQRLLDLWEAFNALSTAGYGDRWADVPIEAALKCTAAEEALAELWRLQEEDRTRALRGLIRVTRGLRSGPLVRLGTAECLARLLVEHGWPEALNRQAEGFLTDWLFALVACPVGREHPTRVQLRARLLQELEQERQAYERRWGKRVVTTAGRSSRPSNPGGSWLYGHPVQELVDGHFSVRRTTEFILPTLALLGPDLSEKGAEMLRRAAKAVPESLERVVEQVGPPGGLTQWSVELLAELAVAYYVDRDANKEEWFQQKDFLYEDGIRSHMHLGLEPLRAGWDRGPFLALGRSDFLLAVTTINRMLNHAARVRSRSTGREPHRWSIHHDSAEYFGDSHVWLWHSGTGIGPLPCMSALQALDMICTDRIRSGHSLESTINTLLVECENIAMVALALRLVVRNIEESGTLLDTFLAQPDIWNLEASRLFSGMSNFRMVAPTEFGSKRRDWTLEQVAMSLVFAQVITPQDSARGDALREIGSSLLEMGEAHILAANLDQKTTEWHRAVLRKWVAHLDSNTYKSREQDCGVALESELPDDVADVLKRGIAEATHDVSVEKCWFKYEPNRQSIGKLGVDVDSDTIKGDVARVREWYEKTGGRGSLVAMNGAGNLAASVVLARAEDPQSVSEKDIVWARDRLLELAQYVGRARERTDSGIDFSPGRLVALALPALWSDIPNMSLGAEERALESALLQLSGSESRDIRLYLAVGLDAIFSAECTSVGECRHVGGLAIVQNLARKADVRLRTKDGGWTLRSRRDAFVRTVEGIPANRLDIGFLVPAIRAAGVAATSRSCVQGEARRALAALVHAFARAGRQQGPGPYPQDNLLVVARALLQQVAANRRNELFDVLPEVVQAPGLGPGLLRGLAAAAEETSELARAAGEVWPDVINHVLDLVTGGNARGRRDRDIDGVLENLVPRQTIDGTYFHRELHGEPERWIDVMAWRPPIDRWAQAASGRAWCLDNLIWMLEQEVSVKHQALFGIPWARTIAAQCDQRIFSGTDALPDWLRKIGAAARQLGIWEEWRGLADGLVVAGRYGVADLED